MKIQLIDLTIIEQTIQPLTQYRIPFTKGEFGIQQTIYNKENQHLIENLGHMLPCVRISLCLCLCLSNLYILKPQALSLMHLGCVTQDTPVFEAWGDVGGHILYLQVYK